MTTTYLSLGGNVGNRRKYLEDALALLDAQCGKIVAVSSFYETEPWGFKSENAFLNIAVAMKTSLTATDFHKEILDIEKKSGRKRSSDARYTDRSIDIDILYFGRQKINSEILKIPHPRIAERKFVLIPFLEIAKITGNKTLHKKVSALLSKCTDDSTPVKL